MSWNYRVIVKKYSDKEINYSIYEVYYDRVGEIEAFSENEIAPSGETWSELVHDLANMKEAFSRPPLIETEPGKLEEFKD